MTISLNIFPIINIILQTKINLTFSLKIIIYVHNSIKSGFLIFYLYLPSLSLSPSHTHTHTHTHTLRNLFFLNVNKMLILGSKDRSKTSLNKWNLILNLLFSTAINMNQCILSCNLKISFSGLCKLCNSNILSDRGSNFRLFLVLRAP